MYTKVNNMKQEEYYSPKEVAQQLKVNKMTIYRWIKVGKIKVHKAGKQYRISKQELIKFLNKTK